MKYAYVRLSRCDLVWLRVLGSGLANLLFPWARAIVATQQRSLTPIWPTWPQIKPGSIIRLRKDLRFYFSLFKNPGNYVDGTEKLWLMATRKRIGERFLFERAVEECDLDEGLVVFSGLNGFFGPLSGYRKFIRRELIRMTRRAHLAGMSHNFMRSITLHIRCGDFKREDDRLLRAGRFNVRLPLRWMKETIIVLRKNLGQDWPVWVFSDGIDKELQEVLALPNVYRLTFGSALADMLAMSRSTVLVPASTFSLWSCFLGEVPAVYYPGQFRQRLFRNKVAFEVVRDWGQDLPPAFLDSVEMRM